MGKRDFQTEQFEVQGAGTLNFGKGASSLCGSACGFHFGVSWSHGGAGGVMDRDEAKRLADHIYAVLDDPATLSRDEAWARLQRALREPA